LEVQYLLTQHQKIPCNFLPKVTGLFPEEFGGLSTCQKHRQCTGYDFQNNAINFKSGTIFLARTADFTFTKSTLAESPKISATNQVS
jgi:hypothetical protein